VIWGAHFCGRLNTASFLATARPYLGRFPCLPPWCFLFFGRRPSFLRLSPSSESRRVWPFGGGSEVGLLLLVANSSDFSMIITNTATALRRPAGSRRTGVLFAEAERFGGFLGNSFSGRRGGSGRRPSKGGTRPWRGDLEIGSTGLGIKSIGWCWFFIRLQR